MWCIISIWQIVLESRFKIHSVQAVIDSENPSAPQGHIISRDVYHSNRSGEQIMRKKVHRNLHTAHLTVNVDKFHSIFTVIQKFQTLLKNTSKILACSTVNERKSS